MIPGLDERMEAILWEAVRETCIMVGWSTLISVLIGLPIGILLATTTSGGIYAQPVLYRALDFVVNVGRSVPFIILMVAINPFTRWVVGTSIGTEAAIVPLSVAAIPFFARLTESALVEVDRGLVEMVQATGGTNWQIVQKVLLPESVPTLVRGVTLTMISLIGYSAMAGVIGGGGLGDLAYRYGYQRFDGDVMLVTIILLVVMVQVIQWVGNVVARYLQHR